MRPVMKEVLKKLFKKLGYKVVNLNSYQRDAFKDQVKLITNNSITIFDVGACTGEVSFQYNDLFTNSTIFCFEPYIPSFRILKEKTSGFTNIKCFNLALSNISGQLDFHVNKSYATNSILATHADSAKNWNEEVLFTIEEIKINSLTLDDFVAQNQIDKIDILKLDTQGTEYQIIEGASQSIKQNKIALIYLEIIIMPTYQEQKNLDEILLLLRNKGFSLYNFYNYSYTNAGELRQVDAIFTRE
jgi:FkbM family methyltransferase